MDLDSCELCCVQQKFESSYSLKHYCFMYTWSSLMITLKLGIHRRFYHWTFTQLWPYVPCMTDHVTACWTSSQHKTHWNGRVNSKGGSMGVQVPAILSNILIKMCKIVKIKRLLLYNLRPTLGRYDLYHIPKRQLINNMFISSMLGAGGARLTFIPAPLPTFALIMLMGYYWRWDTPFISLGHTPWLEDCRTTASEEIMVADMR